MKLYSIVGLLILLFCSCNGKDESKKTIIVDKLKNYIPKDTGSLYYPLDSLFFVPDKDNRHGDSLIKAMDSEILFNLQEPILYNYPGEAIRFLWIRAFNNPIMLRLNKIEDTIYANIKELMNVPIDADHYIPKIGLDTMIILTLKKWEDIVYSLKVNDFWNAQVPDTINDYKDATFWILECRLKNQYHFIERTYLDSTSFKNFEYAKKLYDMGNRIISMKNSRE
jgi:hypothetical protein